MTEPYSIPVTPETHDRFTAAQDAHNLGSDEFVRYLLSLVPIVRATDRLAHDVGRIYDVLP